MNKEKWLRNIKAQIAESVELNTYKVFNSITGEVYMTTKCETVARNCLSRMRSKHGKNVHIEVTTI